MASSISSAGVTPTPAGRWLTAATDRAGRVRVQPDLSVPGHSKIFVLGDTATLDQDGKPLPGVAQVAMQQGCYAGRLIGRRLAGQLEPRTLQRSRIARSGANIRGPSACCR